jgi:HPt (histidine-containing phosphotransfer) domain-containing protein
MPGDRETYLAAGMDGYVAKPIDLENLAAAMSGVALRTRWESPCAGVGAVLDASRLDHLGTMQDDTQPGLVCEVIDMFLGDAPGHLQALQDAMKVRDTERLRRTAHRFLSATQNIGAHNMSGMCMEIELLSRAGDVDGVSRVLAALAQESEQVGLALKAQRLRF